LPIGAGCTWFIPGHSAESFLNEVRQVVESECEIGMYGYLHEGAYRLTIQYERDMWEKYIDMGWELMARKSVTCGLPAAIGMCWIGMG
jgi:hypothetical protein